MRVQHMIFKYCRVLWFPTKDRQCLRRCTCGWIHLVRALICDSKQRTACPARPYSFRWKYSKGKRTHKAVWSAFVTAMLSADNMNLVSTLGISTTKSSYRMTKQQYQLSQVCCEMQTEVTKPWPFQWSLAHFYGQAGSANVWQRLRDKQQ